MSDVVLVDTRVLLWIRIMPDKLAKTERRILDRAVRRYINAVSLWETAILMTLGRIKQDERLFVLPQDFDLLALRPEHCRVLLELPMRHCDPFDRMLIAQARAEKIASLTRDSAIIAYGADGAILATPRHA